MFSLIRRVVSRRPRLVLALALLFLGMAGGVGGGVAESLSNGGFEDPSSQSAQARSVLEDRFGAGAPNLVLLVTAGGGDVDAPVTVAAAERLVGDLTNEADVEDVTSYWTAGRPPPLRNRSGDAGLVLARIVGDDDAVAARVEELSRRYRGVRDGLRIEVGGSAEVFRQMGLTIEHDLVRAEMIAIPITLVLLVVVFGSLVAASLPLLVGAFAILGTFLTLFGLTKVTDVSIFALNLTTMLGLGLAIDYGLFVVSRFREELADSGDPQLAVERTIHTAGRTVAFSALTVSASLAALLVFPLSFLRSFAMAGIPVSLLAAVGAIVVLPAALRLLGHRVDALRIGRRRQSGGGRMWHRMAMTVMRRPVVVAGPIVVFLLLLGAPFLGARWGLPDDRALPPGSDGRTVQDALRSDFGSQESDALTVVVAVAGDPASSTSSIDSYGIALSRLDGAARVDASTGTYIDGQQVAGPSPAAARSAVDGMTWLKVVPSVEAMSSEGEDLVSAIRSTPTSLQDVAVTAHPPSWSTPRPPFSEGSDGRPASSPW